MTRAGLDVLAASASSLTSKLGALVGDGGVGGVTDGGAEGGAPALSFVIPSSSRSGSIDLLGVPLPYTVQVCPGGADAAASPPTCLLDVQIPAGSLHLDAVTPGALTLSGTVPVRLQDLPIDATLIGALSLGFGQGTCNGAVPAFDYASFPVSVTLPLVAETQAPRAGLTKVDTDTAVVSVTADPSSLGICGGCGPGDPVCQTLLDAVKDLAFGLILDQIESQVKAALAPSFCTVPQQSLSPSCPTGSSAGATASGEPVCLYDAAKATCVPVFFGTEGAIAASTFLGSYAPSTAAPLDFLVAAEGPLDPAPGAAADDQGYAGHTPNGVTLSLGGGISAEAVSPCVTPVDVTPPTNLPLPAALTTDTVTGWPSDLAGPHLGVAFAQRYLDYALARTYQSGALCLEVSTAQASALSTGLLSLLVPELPAFTFEGGAASLDVRVRPGAPPTVSVGSGADNGANAILTVHARSLAFDFYVFSDDEYVRAFTFTADVTIPVSLTTAKTAANPDGGLAPVVGQIGFANGAVTNSTLIAESPASIAGGIELVLGTVVGQLFTSLPALVPSSALATYGLSLEVPSAGVQKVTQGTDDFVAVFAALAPATAAMGKAPVGQTRLSLQQLTVDPAGLALEGASRGRLPTLAVQLTPADARAREYAWWIDDGPRSAWSSDASPVIASDALYLQGKHVLSVATRFPGDTASEGPPATLPFLLDVIPPVVSFDGTLHAWDIVSPEAALRARWRSGSADAWSGWVPLAQASTEALTTATQLEVRDEAGNMTSTALGSSGSSGGSGAGDSSVRGGGCSTGGATNANLGDALVLVVALGFALGLRRKRRAALALVAPVACAGLLACGGDNIESSGHVAADAGAAADASVHLCGSDCLQPCLPALDPGVVGAYASLAAAPDGTVWVAAYSDAVITGATRTPYGDLVVGTYDAASGGVDWRTVDGVPALPSGACADHDPSGWRGGVTGPGDDVGLWTSLAIDASGQPMVAYFDATHGALKLARFDGTTWSVHTVSTTVESGRYAKLLLVGGVPTVTYLQQDAATNTSGVVQAVASSPAPASSADWSVTELASGPGVTASGAAQAVPPVTGDYVGVASATPGAPLAGVVFYDQPKGNLVGLRVAGGTVVSQILAGDSRKSGTTDDGQDADLVVDGAGDWHVVYVDAKRAQLDYLDVIGGTTLGVASVIDDGSGVGGQAFADGVHLVGAGAELRIDAAGAPTVYYGDATAGTLRVATGVRSGSGASATYKWTLTAVTQAGRFAGLFPLPLPDGSKIGNAYRVLDASGETDGSYVFVAP